MSAAARRVGRPPAEVLRDAMVEFHDLLRADRELLDRINVFPVADGDTGTNMTATMDAVVAALDTAPLELGPICDAIRHGSLHGARGNSGIILSQALTGLVDQLDGATELDGPLLVAALCAAAASGRRAVHAPVEGTILTVMAATATGAAAPASAGDDLATVLDAAHAAGRKALARTPTQLAALGDAGVVDAGGAGYLRLLDALLRVVAGRSSTDDAPTTPTLAVTTGPTPTEDRADDAARFEVMFLCAIADDRADDLRGRLARTGGSVAVAGGGGTWHCHVHTDDVGAALEAGLDAGGRPHQIRVTDLSGPSPQPEHWRS